MANNTSTNYKYLGKAPLDSKNAAANSEYLTKNIDYAYPGMIRSVKDEGAAYILSAGTNVDGSDPSHWNKIATTKHVDEVIGGIEIPEVPTNVSAFTNDAGYLTEHQSLDGKADKVHEHTDYANKTHNHSLSDITDYVAPSLEGYATEEYVNTAIDNIEIPSIEGLATEEYVDSKFQLPLALGDNAEVGEVTNALAIGLDASALSSNSVAIGHGIKTAEKINDENQNCDQVVLGRFNEVEPGFASEESAYATAENPAAAFIVGIGSSDLNRKNGLVVWSDGRVTVGKEPENLNDVVNKRYLQQVINNLHLGEPSIIAYVRMEEYERLLDICKETVGLSYEPIEYYPGSYSHIPKAYKVTGTTDYCKIYNNFIIPEYYKTIPVTAISESAFNTKIGKVLKVIIPDSIQTIGTAAFKNNTMREVVLPKDLKVLEPEVFADCYYTQYINFPEGLTEIKENACRHTGFLKVILPETVTKIESGAFADAYARTRQIKLPKSLQTLGSTAFSFHENLGEDIRIESLELPFIGDVAESPNLATRCLSYLFGESKPYINKLSLTNAKTVIKSELSGYDKLSELSLNKEISHIDNAALEGCINLSKLVLPFIGEDGASMNTYTYEGSLARLFETKEYYDQVWDNHNPDELNHKIPDNLRTVEILSGSVPAYAFNGCYRKVYNIVLHEGVSAIGTYGLSNTSIQELVLPSTIKELGDGSLSGISHLTYLSIPSTCTKISDYAFGPLTPALFIDVASDNPSFASDRYGNLYNKEFTKLYRAGNENEVDQNFRAPESLREISAYAFSNDYLTSLFLENVEVIHPNAFSALMVQWIFVKKENEYFTNANDNRTLYTKDLAELVEYCGNHPSTEYVMPSSVKSIQASALEDLEHLTKIVFSESLEQIGAISGEALQELDFSQCNNIPTSKYASIYITTKVSDYVIRVPSAKVEEWKADINWSEYADHIVGA